MPQKMVTETQLLRHLANTPYNWILIFSLWRATVLKQLVQSTWRPSIKLFLKSRMSILMGWSSRVLQLSIYHLRKWTIGRNLDRCLSGLRLMSIRPSLSVGGLQAGLYLRYGVEKTRWTVTIRYLSSGHLERRSPSFRALMIAMYPSFSAYWDFKEEVLNKTNLEILSEGPQVGVSILASRDLREIYSFGHLSMTWHFGKRVFSRLWCGFDPHIPENYFKDDDVMRTLSLLVFICSPLFSAIG